MKLVHKIRSIGWVRAAGIASAFALFTGVFQASGVPTVDYYRENVLPSGGDRFSPASLDSVKVDVSIPVEADSTAGSTSEVDLEAGKAYILEAVGTYFWDRTRAQKADAECSQFKLDGSVDDPTWIPDRWSVAGATVNTFPAMFGAPGRSSEWDFASDPLDVYVNGGPVEWVASSDKCDSESHRYTYHFVPEQTGKVRFNVFDPMFLNKKTCVLLNPCVTASSEFVVNILPAGEPAQRPGDVLIESVLVDPRNQVHPYRVHTKSELEEGSEYRFVATGVYDTFQYQGFMADSECTIAAGPQHRHWEAARFNDREKYPDIYMGFDNGDLKILDQFVDWKPLQDTTGKGCNTRDHSYYFVWTPSTTSRIFFGLAAAHHPLNGGMIQVDIYKKTGSSASSGPLPGLAINEPASKPSDGCSGTEVSKIPCSLDLDPRSTTGASLRLPAGDFYLQAVGSYRYHTGQALFNADAECSQGLDPVWQENRYGTSGAVWSTQIPGSTGHPSSGEPWPLESDPYDIYVDGQKVSWKPLNDTGGGCDSNTHAYSYVYKAESEKTVNLKIFDPFWHNAFAGGSLSIRVFSSDPQPDNNLGLPAPSDEDTNTKDQLIAVVPISPKYQIGGGTTVPLTRNRLHKIVVVGSYTTAAYPGTEADAECSSVISDPVWRKDRFGVEYDNLDLLVNDTHVDWRPTIDDGKGCNSSDHRYYINYSHISTNQVSFRLSSVYHRDNQGMLMVYVYALGAAPTG